MSFDTDDEGERYVFNSKGYMENQRIGSAGVPKALETGDDDKVIAVGYIPVKVGDVLRFKNAYVLNNNNGGFNSFACDASYTGIAFINPYSMTNVLSQYITISDVGMSYEAVTEFTIPSTTNWTSTAYMNFTLVRPTADAIPIITINQEME